MTTGSGSTALPGTEARKPFAPQSAAKASVRAADVAQEGLRAVRKELAAHAQAVASLEAEETQLLRILEAAGRKDDGP